MSETAKDRVLERKQIVASYYSESPCVEAAMHFRPSLAKRLSRIPCPVVGEGISEFLQSGALKRCPDLILNFPRISRNRICYETRHGFGLQYVGIFLLEFGKF
jgi:hypothetical protein